eukprot:752919_1
MGDFMKLREKWLRLDRFKGLQLWVMTLMNLYLGFRPHSSCVLEIQWIEFPKNPDRSIKRESDGLPAEIHIHVGPEKSFKHWKRLTIPRYMDYPLFDLVPALLEYVFWMRDLGHKKGFLFPKVLMDGTCHSVVQLDGNNHMMPQTYCRNFRK